MRDEARTLRALARASDKLSVSMHDFLAHPVFDGRMKLFQDSPATDDQADSEASEEMPSYYLVSELQNCSCSPASPHLLQEPEELESCCRCCGRPQCKSAWDFAYLGRFQLSTWVRGG